MEKEWIRLLEFIMKNKVSDVHMTLMNNKLKLSIRSSLGIQDVKEEYPDALFHYLKFMANLDLGSINIPQSGNFTYMYKDQPLYFRFAYLQTLQVQTAVLRVLNNHDVIKINDLSKDSKQNNIFERWSHFRSGLVLISGPTGSGKTTTLHAILENISKNNCLKVISLEDPVEIQSNSYLQLQINEKRNFTYEEGIKQLLRHDPDVIMIGEVRDKETALSLLRCALSGHMVFTTIHAKSCKEAIMRLLDLGVNENDLKEVLTGLTNQRIYPSVDKKDVVCIYEIMERKDVNAYFENDKRNDHKDIFKEIESAVSKGWICKEEAQKDLIF